MSGPGSYGTPQNQRMYSHQTMQRNTSGGQLGSMMQHPGMMISSSQPQMMTQKCLRNNLHLFSNEVLQQPGIMVSQAGYSQTMVQQMPQMMATMGQQPHIGQPMNQAMMQQQQQQQQQPHIGQPQIGQPQIGQPQIGQPQIGQPQIGQSQIGQPQIGQPQSLVQATHMTVPMSQAQAQVVANASHMTSQQVYMSHPQRAVVQQAQSTVSTAPLYAQPRNSPHSVPAPLSQGPPSTGGPASNNPQTPMNPASQQHPTPATPQQAPSSVQSLPPQESVTVQAELPPDPICVARLLILKDLRHSIEKLSRATSEYFGSALGNPPSANPQSVNPQSVNPMSVNPMSVNPSSVKSDEPKSVEAPEKKAALTPKDVYNNALDEFLAVCDQIETNLLVFQEAQRQFKGFDKMLNGQVLTPNDLANVNYPAFAQSYIDLTTRLRNAIRSTVDNNNAVLQQLRAARVGLFVINLT
uniref:Mediator of RNA polymerase II transcription subunit 29 n=1 Tax=Syphacia muris TaxID=451379 RepID=A0A0N5ALU4_9BILA